MGGNFKKVLEVPDKCHAIRGFPNLAFGLWIGFIGSIPNRGPEETPK